LPGPILLSGIDETHLMAGGSQSGGDFPEEHARGCRIRRKILVQEKNPHVAKRSVLGGRARPIKIVKMMINTEIRHALC
jgi:hypothetical protein